MTHSRKKTKQIILKRLWSRPTSHKHLTNICKTKIVYDKGLVRNTTKTQKCVWQKPYSEYEFKNWLAIKHHHHHIMDATQVLSPLFSLQPPPRYNHRTETNLQTLTCIDITYSVNLYTNLTYKKYLYFCGLLIFA